jgi:hypothetical protein
VTTRERERADLPRISLAEMRQHVLDLCERSGIIIEWRSGYGGAYAIRMAEEICTPPIKSVITYATALHEIGHVLGRHQSSRCVMVRERWAWKWARNNALLWTPAMQRSAERSLAWYMPRAAKIDRRYAEDRIFDASGAELRSASGGVGSQKDGLR